MVFTIQELEVELRTLAARKSHIHNELQQITGACAIVEQMILILKQKESQALAETQPTAEVPVPEPVPEEQQVHEGIEEVAA